MKFFWKEKGMNKFYLKSIIILIISNILFGCQSLKDGLEGNKKSKSAEEFLIEKKNPLVLPPDFSKLPGPDEEIKEKNKEESQFEMVFKKDNSDAQKNESTRSSDSGLEKSILKKIQKQ